MKNVAERRRVGISREVAVLLRERREARGLSMLAVAERAGISQQMVSYVERGMRNPTVDTLVRLAGALDWSAAGVLKKAEARAAEAALPPV